MKGSPIVLSRLTVGVSLFVFTAVGVAHATSVLDVGTDYRLRGIAYSNPDFGETSGQNIAYYSQRALAHVGARFSPNIEFMTQFQAIGVAGSSTSVNNSVANQTGNHYPNINFTPFIQWAYFKAGQLYDLPLDLTVGRQPILLGDGLILSDDDVGFTGVRVQSRFTEYGFNADVFAFEPGNTLSGSAATDIYGLELAKPLQNIRLALSFVNERDASGQTVYIRPSENPANFPAGTNFMASSIVRTFYDARLEGRLSKGGFYKGEFALQNGHINRSPSLGGVDLGGYGVLFSAGLFTNISKYGPIELHVTFGQGSGDSGGSKDNAFHPDFGHRFDGLERSGFGEFMGATVYDALSSSGNPTGLPPGASGLRVIGGGITTHPTALLSIGIDYFVYDVMENNVRAYPTLPAESSLGSEFDLGIGFAYTNYLSFRGSAAFFSPGKVLSTTPEHQGRRFLIEAIGRF